MAKILLFVLLLVSWARAQTSTENPHGSIKWDCQSCHTTASWKTVKEPMDFKHEDTGFLLIGAHKFTDCVNCHQSLKFSEVGSACADCHTDVHRGQFGNTCQNCHTSNDWRNQQEMLQLHSTRGFPLVGVHAIADCQACHVNDQYNEFSGTPVDCNSCHLSEFAQTDNPSHSKAGFNMDCQSCHQPLALKWNNTTYKHPEVFELKGAHSQLDCNTCHASAYFGTPAECYGCHAVDFENALSPPHASSGFSQNCEICHTETAWQGAVFDHLTISGFALSGAHNTLLCVNCHAGNQFAGTPRECFGCHENDFNIVANPNHLAGHFPTDCMVCHNDNTWTPADFNHDLSAFPLTGAHKNILCEDCHENGQFTALPAECYACHDNDFNEVSEPNHVQNNFSHDCTVCHSTSAWLPATFDHSQTQFPLTGVHISLNCIDCHASGYAGTPTDCYSCHEADFTSVSDPNHVQNNFSHDCTVCHSTSAWSPATFDHNQTQFPLTGAHISLNCIDCHANGYAGTPTDCFSCHENDFTSVSDPNHVQNNFSHDCTICHSTNGWSPATFDHNQTQFPLTGAHISLNCIDCHANGYAGTPTDCFSCHEADFTSVSDPNHVQNNFSHDCTVCHSTSAWSPATFDHNQTQFPLTGAHISLNCIDCHANGYAGTPTDCFSCHENDFNSVSDPNHVQNNFSHDCTICHSTNGWSPATFDHNQTQFPLTGAHLNLQCIDCHSNGYAGTPTDCYSCHQNDYNNTTDPNHVAAGFPTTCEVCHNTSNWNQTTWDHDALYFPIYSGKHEGEWQTCTDCHVNPSNYAVFECIFCHEHNQQEMDDKHQGVSGYIYLSSACYQCHPNGESRIRMERMR